MKKALIILLVILAINPLFSSNQEDLDYLVKTLPAVHKNFYNNRSESEFASFISSLGDVEKFSDMEFYYLLSSICAFAGDSHTGVSLQTIPQNLQLLPLRFISFPDGIFVYASNKEYEAILGSRLIGINGYSINAIKDKASKILPHDNEIFLYSQLTGNLIYPDFLKVIGAVSDYSKGILLTIEQYGVIKSVVVKPVLLSEENGADYLMVFKDFPSTYASGYYRSFELSDSAFFVQYNTCQNSPEMSVADFTSLVQAELEKKPYKKVIVDFRYNGGGNSSLFEPFMDYLSSYGASVYGLIGSGTFSSGIMNALYLKEKCSAVLVGTPTGGCVNAFGELGFFPLPSGRFSIMYSTEYFYLSEDYEGVLTPDVTIETSFADFLSLRDREVEYCLK